MLRPEDADLIERDERLPGLRALLDPEVLISSLRAAGSEVESVACDYLRYKPRTNCVAALRWYVAGRQYGGYAKAYPAGEREKVAASVRRAARPCAAAGIPAVLEDRGIVLHPYPLDAKLPSLERLGDAAARQSLLRSVLGDRIDLKRAEVRCVKYKPERRCVVAISVDDRPLAAVKFYTPGAYEAAREAAKGLRSVGPLTTPRRLGRSNRHRAVASQWLSGRSLHQPIGGEADEAAIFGQVGAALAALHGQRCRHVTERTPGASSRQIAAVAESVAFLCPSLAEQARQLASRLTALRLNAPPPIAVTLHGDFYARQVLVEQGRVAIVDLDNAVRGDPAADVGCFVAHLEQASLCGEIDPAVVTRRAAWLVDGYQRAPGGDGEALGDARHLQVAVAEALFGLAPEPFRHRQAEWAAGIGRVLRRTQELLDQLPPARRPRVHRSPALEQQAPGAARPRPPRGGAVAEGGQGASNGATFAGDGSGGEVVVEDPSAARCDASMTFLAAALDPDRVRRMLSYRLPEWMPPGSRVELRRIAVVRYKPLRRCVVQYDLADRETGAIHRLLGKCHARSKEQAAYDLQVALRRAGFADDASDRVHVPRPIGVIPQWQMWLQEKIDGDEATDRLAGPEGVSLARRIARAIVKLHRAGVAARRTHAMADELLILRSRLQAVARQRPEWQARLERVFRQSVQVGERVASTRTCGIHRDFHPGQVLVAHKRLLLIDFDLYARGDAGLDAGNFAGHLIELAVRQTGRAGAWDDRVEAFVEQFVADSGEETRFSVAAYTLLTLARHIYLSTQYASRGHTTEPLLQLCEQRLANGMAGTRIR